MTGTIAPRTYKVFYEALNEIDLEYTNDTVTIQSLTVPYPIIDSLEVTYLFPDQCYDRLYDGAGNWITAYLPTLGFGNSLWSTTPTPTITPIGPIATRNSLPIPLK